MASLDLDAERSGSMIRGSELSIVNAERPTGSGVSTATGVLSPACKQGVGANARLFSWKRPSGKDKDD